MWSSAKSSSTRWDVRLSLARGGRPADRAARRAAADDHPLHRPGRVPARRPGGSLQMTAFGPEANFATPRRPRAAAGLAPDWTVKLRTRSSYVGMLGQDIAAMMRGQRRRAGSRGRSSPAPRPRRPRRPARPRRRAVASGGRERLGGGDGRAASPRPPRPDSHCTADQYEALYRVRSTIRTVSGPSRRSGSTG